jgi:uncharacterized membrane protein
MPNKKHKKEDDSRIFAFLAVFFTIIGFVIAILARKDDKYVMFYAKQGLAIFIIQLIASFAWKLPIVGWLTGLTATVLFIITWISAWLNALSGEKVKTVFIGEFADKIRL